MAHPSALSSAGVPLLLTEIIRRKSWTTTELFKILKNQDWVVTCSGNIIGTRLLFYDRLVVNRIHDRFVSLRRIDHNKDGLLTIPPKKNTARSWGQFNNNFQKLPPKTITTRNFEKCNNWIITREVGIFFRATWGRPCIPCKNRTYAKCGQSYFSNQTIQIRVKK